MLANALFQIFAYFFIGGFFAILALGHLLLAAAIWPGLLKRSEPLRETAVDTGQQAHQH